MTNLDELIHYTFICILYDVLHVISTSQVVLRNTCVTTLRKLLASFFLCKFGQRFLTSFFLHEQKFNPHCCPIFFSGGMIYTILSLHYLRMLYKCFGCFYPHGLWKIFYRFSFYLFFSFFGKISKTYIPCL